MFANIVSRVTRDGRKPLGVTVTVWYRDSGEARVGSWVESYFKTPPSYSTYELDMLPFAGIAQPMKVSNLSSIGASATSSKAIKTCISESSPLEAFFQAI